AHHRHRGPRPAPQQPPALTGADGQATREATTSREGVSAMALARDQGATMAEEEQLVVFRIMNEEFGVPIQRVREIIKVPHITHLPHSAAYVEGVINLRGDVLPVINLRRRFGLSAEEKDDNTRIMIVEYGSGQVGLVVDAVTEVLRIPKDAIGPPPAHVAGLRTELIAGIGKLEDRLLILLDPDQLLTSEDEIRFSDLTASAAEAAATAEASGPSAS